ncbi:MAG: class I SAM-dependent methyltransferase [Tepidisphaerales bacterium]
MPRRRPAVPAHQPYRAIPAYYDAEYAHLPYLQTDVPFLLRHLPRRPQRILELAVGTGRAAIPLAEAGHRVVGVDNDPAMLERAEAKRRISAVSPRRLKLVCGDIRTYRHPGGRQRFDAVLLLFNTLLAFPDIDQLDAVLATAAYHLRPGGLLWVDVFNPDFGQLAHGPLTGLDPVTFYVPELDRTVTRWTDLEDISPPAFQRRRVTFHYRWFDRGRERHRAVRFDMTWLLPRELQVLLQRHGLVLRQLWGDHDGSPVSHDSPRLIAAARKPAGPRAARAFRGGPLAPHA